MYYLYFIIYIILVNLFGFLAMYVDKKKAIKGSYRIAEKTFFIIALFLGATGVYLGMYCFRHKTKHYIFTVGLPITIILNIFTIYYIVTNQIFLNLI